MEFPSLSLSAVVSLNPILDMQFTDAAGRLVADLAGEQGGLLGRSRALLLAPLGQDLGMGSRTGNAQLRGALERFVTDRYLPDIYVAFR